METVKGISGFQQLFGGPGRGPWSDEQVGTEGPYGSEAALCAARMMNARHHALVQLHRMNYHLNYGLWVIRTCQRTFISSNECTALLGDAGN